MRYGVIRVFALALFLGVTASAASVYTTDVTGTVVNGNLYTDKTDVYLTGGPQSNCGGGSQLPDGTYYFQVTDPSASTLLSSDGIGPRTVTVVGGVITGYVSLPPDITLPVRRRAEARSSNWPRLPTRRTTEAFTS